MGAGVDAEDPAPSALGLLFGKDPLEPFGEVVLTLVAAHNN
jgi:hypothetical protein